MVQAGSTVGATVLAVALTAPFTGMLSDAIGRKPIIVGSVFFLAVPTAELDAATMRLVTRIAGVPSGHLRMHKLVVNQIMLTMGLEQAQTLATVFDGITRHNPEGLWFRRHAQQHGFKSAIEWRDSGRPIPAGDEARALIRAMEGKGGAG